MIYENTLQEKVFWQTEIVALKDGKNNKITRYLFKLSATRRSYSITVIIVRTYSTIFDIYFVCS